VKIKELLMMSAPCLKLNFKCKAVKIKEKRSGIVAGYN
jgi:hypothetical protein